MASPSTRSLGSSYRSLPPRHRLRIVRVPVALVVTLLRAYRIVVSPVFGNVCRFAPSCSRYAEEAVTAHGMFAGSRMAIARIARCHPWSRGGYDPVPERRGV